jgi:hypothetical protein
MRKNLKFLILICIFVFCIFNFKFLCYAQNITILYTGETHAMLYPCNCPKEPDGAIARRATLIKELKKNNPHTLILDSGGFFAGGLLDEYTQNTELDKARTLVNLKAMELMKYDAVTIGDDEFNFGREFLEQNITKSGLTFLSGNIKSALFKPYTIKEMAGLRIGIIGLTTPSALSKAGGLEFLEPKKALKGAVEELKKNKVDLIILLSHLGEADDTALLKEIPGINILITGHSSQAQGSLNKIGSTLILRPSWQGRRLGKITLKIKDKKIAEHKLEDLRLSDKIADDPQVLSILPRCFSDNNCKKQGMVGMCQDPGAIKSQCLFAEASRVDLTIITPKACKVCETQRMIKFLKSQFPGLMVSYLYYPDAQAKKLIADLGIKGLPVYLLGKETEKEKGFDNLKNNLETKGDFYLLKPWVSGIAYFLDRKEIKGKLDLFISIYDKDMQNLLDAIKKFNPQVHFLAIEQKDGFDAKGGNLEVEEYLRAVCVQKYYPQKFWDYIICRAKNIQSSWWEDCAVDLDTQKIKTCARGEEGKNLLKENVTLNKELQVMFGPTYLLDNHQIFGSQGAPSEEEFKKIFKR